MYGFNKLNAGANAQASNQPQNVGSTSDIWEFKHPEFERGGVEKLHLIKRKASKPSITSLGPGGGISKQSSHANLTGGVSMSTEDYIGVAGTKNGGGGEHVGYLINKVRELEEKLEKLHESHSLLWSETVACRVLQSKHHQVIGNAITFLSSIYQDSETGNAEVTAKSKKRKLDGMY